MPGSRGSASLFDGPGEMRARCRALDWSSTKLGAVDTWSQSLRTTVFTVLSSRQPMFLFWGPHLVQIYNDAYRPSLGTGGRESHALGACGHEFWTEIWDTIGPQINQVMAGGEATWFEDQYLPIERNGRMEEVYWTYCYGPVRDDDDSIGGTLVVCQETTNRVIAERALDEARARAEAATEHLERVIKQSPVAMYIARGRDHVFEVVSESWFQMVGKKPAEVIGRAGHEVFPELAAQGLRQLIDDVFVSGTAHYASSMPMLFDTDGDGVPEEHFFNLVYHPLRDGEGIVYAIALVANEVTHLVLARRHAEETRAAAVLAAEERERLLEDAERARASAEIARFEAETANRAKSDFLAVMSHELRTPLNAIGGYAELIELGIHGHVTPEQRNALARIQASQRHLLGLITSVLNYARVESGVLTYAREQVVLTETIATCEALTAPQMRTKELTLHSSTTDPTLRADADREKVQQIILNLLGNAVKFTDAGGRIDVRCSAAGGTVVVQVEDTGVGIRADQLSRVFDPFVQVDTKLTRTNEGVGLGLAISRDLARGMKGDLHAESTPGVGSVFTLTLPRL